MTEWREPRYFPAKCPAGHRAFLAAVSADPTRSEPLRCPVCDAESRVIPGAYYTQATRERFDRVAAALQESELTQEQRASAVAFLDRAARDSETDAQALSQMLSQIPALSQLAAVIPEERRERHAFVGLVLSLLVAGVSVRRNEPPRPLTLPSDEGAPPEPTPANDPATETPSPIEKTG